MNNIIVGSSLFCIVEEYVFVLLPTVTVKKNRVSELNYHLYQCASNLTCTNNHVIDVMHKCDLFVQCVSAMFDSHRF